MLEKIVHYFSVQIKTYDEKILSTNAISVLPMLKEPSPFSK